MEMSETDPIRDAIEQSWEATITLDMGDDIKGVSLIAATEAYVAYEDHHGDHVVIPWWQIASVRLAQGAKRAL